MQIALSHRIEISFLKRLLWIIEEYNNIDEGGLLASSVLYGKQRFGYGIEGIWR